MYAVYFKSSDRFVKIFQELVIITKFPLRNVSKYKCIDISMLCGSRISLLCKQKLL